LIATSISAYKEVQDVDEEPLQVVAMLELILVS